MQHALTHMAHTTLLMPGTTIIVTPDVASKFRTLNFEMSDEEDLSTGLHPFTFGYMDNAELTSA